MYSFLVDRLRFYINLWPFLLTQDESPGSPKKKKDAKKKFKLEPHEEQLFLDGNEVCACVRVHVRVVLLDVESR